METTFPAADAIIFTLFSTSQDAMIITRARDGVCLAANEAFTRVSGYTAAEAIGHSTVDDLRLWVVAEDRKRLLQPGGVSGLEASLRHKDGTIRHIQHSAWPINFHGEACLIAIARDLTAQDEANRARQQAEADLRQAHEQLEKRVQERTAELSAVNAALQLSEARLRAYIEHSPQGLFIVDAAGRYQEANPAACQLVGYAREELCALSIPDLVPPADVEAAGRLFGELMTTGALTAELYLQKKDRSRVPVILNAVTLPDGTAMAFCLDITARQQAEIALRESERRYRELFSTVRLAIFQSTLEGKVLAVNPEFASMFGYESAEAVAAQVKDVAREIFADPERRAEIISLKAQHPDLKIFESVYRRSDGSTFLGRSNIDQVVDLQGQAFFQGFIEDITQRKQAELLIQRQAELLRVQNEELHSRNEELMAQGKALAQAEAGLRAANVDLERRVEARTQELSLANASLKRAAQMKDEFLASMSHELRTPLTAVQGLAEALQMGIYGPLTEKQYKALGTIHESGQHLLALITDILDVSKLEAGKLELQLGPVSVEDICQASVRFVRELARKKKLHVALALDPQVDMLRADARRLKQMLVNLLSNAVKFTPAGGDVGLTVEGDAARQVVRFVVWDTGIGIAPENLPRLFKPFTQLDSRLAREYEGTGLGLSLVQSMAELHGGEVTVESDGVPGKGSRFTLTLPWRRVEAAAQNAETTTPRPSPRGRLAENRAAVAPTVLLLVDDDELTLLALSALLQTHAYQVHTAANGAEALARAQALRPDVILLDIQMPGMDGLEVIRRLRDIPALAGVPIVALTALAMAGDRERCLEAGANAYLSKPVARQELVQTIRNLLGAPAR